MINRSNSGFTKLEIILVGTILLIIIGFLSTKNLNLFNSKENLLRQRYNKYVSLLNDKNYSEAYSFFSSSMKKVGSLEEFLKSTSEASNIAKQNSIINKIVIKDNIGYIDRNNTICEDNNCNTKIEVRGYKKWIFENSNWYLTNENPWCIREEMYDMPPEFKRALSLINQRFTNYYKKYNAESSLDMSFFNCVDIQYGDTGSAEGLFTFDKNSSSFEKLNIIVNKSYVNNDDLLTALLLAHETVHSSSYLKKVSNDIEISCVEDETGAFTNQLLFLGMLNDEEKKSIRSRLTQGYQNLNNQLTIVWDLLTLRDQAQRICGSNEWDNCTTNESSKLIEKMVIKSPFYQKQCGLN